MSIWTIAQREKHRINAQKRRNHRLTRVQAEFLHMLSGGPMTASYLGFSFWGKPGDLPQWYAIPAAKVLRHLERRRLVRLEVVDGKRLWHLV